MAVDRDTGVLDLSVFAVPLRGNRTRTVGTATLRMADVPEVLRLLTERTPVRKFAARRRIRRQKIKEVEGKKALGPLSLSRRSVQHA
jgi:hypothetical protein